MDRENRSLTDTATQGYIVDIFGGGKPNPRNINPLGSAPTRRHRRPDPKTLEPGKGFVLGENAQSGVSKTNGGRRGGATFR